MDGELQATAGRLVALAAQRSAENTQTSCKEQRPAEAIDRTVRILARRAGVPPRFMKAYLADFPGEVRSKVTGFLRGETQGVFLFGEAGVGKTHLAAALLRAYLEQEVRGGALEEDPFTETKIPSAYFVTVPDMLLSIRSSFSATRGRTEEEAVRRYASAGLLVLDDLGAEKVTDFAASVLFMIVNGRYSTMRPMIVSSNYSLDEIMEKIGDRIASRLAGMGAIIHLEGPDRRLGDQGNLW